MTTNQTLTREAATLAHRLLVAYHAAAADDDWARAERIERVADRADRRYHRRSTAWAGARREEATR